MPATKYKGCVFSPYLILFIISIIIIMLIFSLHGYLHFAMFFRADIFGLIIGQLIIWEMLILKTIYCMIYTLKPMA